MRPEEAIWRQQAAYGDIEAMEHLANLAEHQGDMKTANEWRARAYQQTKENKQSFGRLKSLASSGIAIIYQLIALLTIAYKLYDYSQTDHSIFAWLILAPLAVWWGAIWPFYWAIYHWLFN